MAPPSLPGGASDEDDGEDKPEHVAEDDDLHHVQVGPAGFRGQGSMVRLRGLRERKSQWAEPTCRS